MGREVTPPLRQVRAAFDENSITVYQAYRAEIADAALAAGTFVAPFSTTRMTWIKPSFLWMMYRCGWATKPDQERVLAVRMSRAGFEQALGESCWSHFDAGLHPDREAWRAALDVSPVRVQWDPERTPSGDPLPHRSLQVGLAGGLLQHYLDEWILDLTDLTPRLPGLREGRDPLPEERPYPLPAALAAHIGATA